MAAGFRSGEVPISPVGSRSLPADANRHPGHSCRFPGVPLPGLPLDVRFYELNYPVADILYHNVGTSIDLVSHLADDGSLRLVKYKG